jgi:coniferyl-aldehyde dehydrogenase
MVKLTEVTPHTSNLLKSLFEKYFDETEVIGITGGPETGAAFSSLALDHIIFTGATSIGKYVLQGAANNLTPVTLELGGKSPVIVGESADSAESALRIFTGKAFNVGQVCISPDYAFVHESKLEQFVADASAHISKMYPTMLENNDYSSIVNKRHFERLQSYLQDAKDKGGDVRPINPANEDFSQQQDTHKMPMTLVINPTDDMKVMTDEIFGPIMSIKSYKDIAEVIAFINAGPRPLALYYFGKDKAEQAKVLNQTTSGGVAINDVISHAGVEDIPFGGIGPSGMGNYHGYEGFKTFSHAKAVFTQSNIYMMKFTGMIPPTIIRRRKLWNT